MDGYGLINAGKDNTMGYILTIIILIAIIFFFITCTIVLYAFLKVFHEEE